MAYLSDKAALRHLERVLRSARVDGWEIYLSGTRELSVEARDGEVESLQRAVSRGVGVRVLRGGAPGFAFTTNFRAEALDAAARAATDAARYATPDPALGLIAPQRLPRKELALFDPALSRVSQKKRVAMALELEAATRAADKRITQVRSASYEEDASWLHLRNSEGLCLEDRETSAGLSVMAVAGDEDESEAGYEFQDVRFFAELNPARVARGAARDAVRQLGARPVRENPALSYSRTLLRPNCSTSWLIPSAPIRCKKACRGWRASAASASSASTSTSSTMACSRRVRAALSSTMRASPSNAPIW